jgi:catechol 2,3-dioxygenase
MKAGRHSIWRNAMDKPITPRGINHLVLNVRDMEESHRFWTEIVGFRQVGRLTPLPDRPNPPMRFYSGDKEGETHHHDIALVENRDLPPPPREWAMFGMPSAVNHVAITMPSREAWLAHLGYLQKKGIKFDRRIEHGMTHSLYIHDVYDLPKEIWKDDINGALNWAKVLPTEGPEALEDSAEGLPTFRRSAPGVE